MVIHADTDVMMKKYNDLSKSLNDGTDDNLNKCAVELMDYLNSIITVLEIATYDLLPGVNAKDASTEYKTIALKKFLQKYGDHADHHLRVLIEEQPQKIGGPKFTKVNTESPMVAHQLCYHFAPNAKMVKSSLKSQISFAPELSIDVFMAAYAAKYKNATECKRKARKEHTKANLKWFMSRFAPHIKLQETNLDDSADALMQIFTEGL